MIFFFLASPKLINQCGAISTVLVHDYIMQDAQNRISPLSLHSKQSEEDSYICYDQYLNTDLGQMTLRSLPESTGDLSSPMDIWLHI